MYKLIWKKEVIDEVIDKDEADMLMKEYNINEEQLQEIKLEAFTENWPTKN